MMTMTEKIIADKCGKKYVRAGEQLECQLDLACAEASEGHRAILNCPQVFDKEKIAITADFAYNCNDGKELIRSIRAYARSQSLPNFYDIGNGAINMLICEKGLVTSGMLVVGDGKYTSACGAVGALGLSLNPCDLADAMKTGKCKITVPDTIKVVLQGKMNIGVAGSDLVFHILKQIGAESIKGKVLEFSGDGLCGLTMDDRFTISSLIRDIGGVGGAFPTDEIALSYIRYRSGKEALNIQADEDSSYYCTVEVNLAEVTMNVLNAKNLSVTALEDISDNIVPTRVIIGGSVGGGLMELSMAARILEGRRIAPDICCMVIPATNQVYGDSLKLGYLDLMVQAGCVICRPSGICNDTLKGEVVLSTSGNGEDQYILSPYVAAFIALAGSLTDKIKEQPTKSY